MAVKVRLPAPLQNLTNGEGEVSAEGKTVREVINDLDGRFASIKTRLCEENGELRRFVNIFLNDEDIRFLNNLDTQVKDNDELTIIPAIAGGQKN